MHLLRDVEESSKCLGAVCQHHGIVLRAWIITDGGGFCLKSMAESGPSAAKTWFSASVMQSKAAE